MRPVRPTRRAFERAGDGIATDCDVAGLDGSGAVLEARADHNPKLKVKGIVVNQFQARAKLPQRMVDELLAEGLPVLQPYLSSSVRIRESHEQSLPMIYLDPQHKLTQAFVALHAVLGAV